MGDVQIPAKAVSATGQDILDPTAALLRGVNLLGTAEDNKQADSFGATFKGPPASVALIEAGATAASKWWATGLAAGVAVAWGRVAVWWDGQQPDTQRAVLLAAGIVTAAAVLGIAYLLGSDVRGRSIAAVATIEARARIAEAMIQTAQVSAAAPTATATPSTQLVTLPEAFSVRHTALAGADEIGWRAVAVLTDGKDIIKYLVIKGAAHEWVDAAGIATTSPN
ncbi:hypothetical protein ACFPJ1_08400 [Kribbella qitaiheensis]|uniref:hypothetical protein n=1 Tax=Kribbella qitaiheensis TaxID=1544730 RepID=UPI00361977F4